MLEVVPWEKQCHGVNNGHILKLAAYRDEMSFMDIREKTNQKVNENSKASWPHEHFKSYHPIWGQGDSVGCIPYAHLVGQF